MELFLKYRHEQWLDRESIEKLQKERLERAISAAAAVPYYGRLLRDLGSSAGDVASDPSLLPITKKEAVKNNPGSFMAPGALKSRLVRQETSGSSGTPIDIFFDSSDMNSRAAIFLLVQSEFGRTPFDSYAEISHATPASFPLSALGLFRKLHISVFEDEARMFSILKRARPDIIGWIPSVLSILARMNLSDGRPLRPKSVFCGAEMLTSGCRKLIEDAFSSTVSQLYASTEFAAIAWECPEEHNLHVSSSTCFLEIVDGNGRPKKSGKGQIVVSSLQNRAMPLLRYALGDVGSWGGDCSCGRGLPVLKSLEGRVDDFIVLPDGRLRSSFSFDFLEELSSVNAYQIVQEREDHFVFRYVPSGREIDGPDMEAVISMIKRGCLGGDVGVEFERVSRIPRSRSGKLSAVISKIKPKNYGMNGDG
jgi:phenylacetate-CoA ligase